MTEFVFDHRFPKLEIGTVASRSYIRFCMGEKRSFLERI